MAAIRLHSGHQQEWEPQATALSLGKWPQAENGPIVGLVSGTMRSLRFSGQPFPRLTGNLGLTSRPATISNPCLQRHPAPGVLTVSTVYTRAKAPGNRVGVPEAEGRGPQTAHSLSGCPFPRAWPGGKCLLPPTPTPPSPFCWGRFPVASSLT